MPSPPRCSFAVIDTHARLAPFVEPRAGDDEIATLRAAAARTEIESSDYRQRSPSTGMMKASSGLNLCVRCELMEFVLRNGDGRVDVRERHPRGR